ncbi:MAG: hypothetical protein ACRDZX_06085 [Acidimicrobiales bacterium]
MIAPTASGQRLLGTGPSSSQAGPRTIDLFRSRVVAALATYFNFLSLSLALLITCLPLVTIPLALHAATVALERWRAEGEDRVVREFLGALRSANRLRVTLATGVPLLVAATALEEVHYFARGGPGMGWVCLGFGAVTLLIALTSIGYVLLMGVRYPTVPVPELWTFCVRLALSNLFVTGPLFLLEVAGTTLLGLLDPALLLIGLPLGLLALLRLTAEIGARRCGYGRIRRQPSSQSRPDKPSPGAPRKAAEVTAVPSLPRAGLGH